MDYVDLWDQCDQHVPGVGCWKQCAVCTTGHVIQNHGCVSRETVSHQVVVVQGAVFVTRTCSAHDEAFKSSVPTPAERWEASFVFSVRGCAPPDGVTATRTIKGAEWDAPTRLRKTLRCLPQRLFQFLSPFGLRRKRAYVATVSSTTSYQKFALEAIAHVSFAQGSLMPP